MRHKVHTFKIGRTGAHRRAMLANMVSSLFMSEKGQIKTTVIKAKEARRVAEKMITLGKKGDLHRRRLAIAKLRNKDAVKILFDEIAPKYADRNGGYTRIMRLGKRLGDGAEMCILQLVEGQVEAKAKKAPVKAAEEVKAEEVVEEETVAEVETAEAAEETAEKAE